MGAQSAPSLDRVDQQLVSEAVLLAHPIYLDLNHV